MLIEFKVANYRSIRAEQTLSMVASNYSDELPQNLISCDHVPGLKGTKLVKAVALYGANASGKSNIVAALRFFAEFVRDSATKRQPGDPTGAQPFKLDPACLTEPSKFEITAVINGIRTLYGIELTNEKVTSEYLVAYPNGKPQRWFERDWNTATGNYDWSDPTKNFKHDEALHNSARPEISFLSAAVQLNHPEATAIWKWFSSKIQFLDSDNESRPPAPALKFLRSTEGAKRLKVAVTAADVGVENIIARIGIDAVLKRAEAAGVDWGKFEFEENKTKFREALKAPPRDDEEVEPVLFHKGADGKSFGLEFLSEESSGTKRFLSLVSQFMQGVPQSTLFVADEIEASLHPVLVRQLIEWFAAAETDLNSQFIFTTHNPLLLDQTLLRRDQIWFTEKDQEGATRLYPLTDFKPRKDESLVKGYLAGRYGGIPFIPEGMKF